MVNNLALKAPHRKVCSQSAKLPAQQKADSFGNLFFPPRCSPRRVARCHSRPLETRCRSQAGWHVSRKLKVPANITLVPLPAKAPELNPVENIWQFMRENWISNRVFTSYNDILDHCCAAWNKLIDQPWTIMSIGWREWAYE